MEWKGISETGSRTLRNGTAFTAAALLASTLLLAGCGKKEEGPVAEGPKGEKTVAAVASDSACVSCHTDRERLKMESAGIKRPPKSAMTSGKG